MAAAVDSGADHAAAAAGNEDNHAVAAAGNRITFPALIYSALEAEKVIHEIRNCGNMSF